MQDDEYELGESENFKNQNTNTIQKKDFVERIGIEDFYKLMVEDWTSNTNIDYKLYLQQGNIPAKTIYNVLGLNPFQIPTDEDIKRIKEWNDEWSKESEIFNKIDITKTQELKNVIGVLTGLFKNKAISEDFRNVIKKSTWRSLSPIITDKCSDGIVELSEMASILNFADNYGLLIDEIKLETIKSIENEISKNNSKIQSFDEAFNSYFIQYTNQNPNNSIDNSENRDKLSKKFEELLNIQNRIKSLKNEEMFTIDFDSYLAKSNLKLKSSVLPKNMVIQAKNKVNNYYIELLESLSSQTENVTYQDLDKIIKFHGIGAAASSAAAGLIPGAGGVAATACYTGFVWSMYVRLSKKIGLPFNKNIIKALASAVVTNLAATAATTLIATAVISLIPGIGSIAASATDAALGYAVVTVSGIIYMKLLTKLLSGKNKIDLNSLSEKEIKQMAEKTIKETDVKSLLQQAKSDYKTVKNEKIVIEDDDVDDELELV